MEKETTKRSDTKQTGNKKSVDARLERIRQEWDEVKSSIERENPGRVWSEVYDERLLSSLFELEGTKFLLGKSYITLDEVNKLFKDWGWGRSDYIASYLESFSKLCQDPEMIEGMKKKLITRQDLKEKTYSSADLTNCFETAQTYFKVYLSLCETEPIKFLLETQDINSQQLLKIFSENYWYFRTICDGPLLQNANVFDKAVKQLIVAIMPAVGKMLPEDVNKSKLIGFSFRFLAPDSSVVNSKTTENTENCKETIPKPDAYGYS